MSGYDGLSPSDAVAKLMSDGKWRYSSEISEAFGWRKDKTGRALRKLMAEGRIVRKDNRGINLRWLYHMPEASE